MFITNQLRKFVVLSAFLLSAVFFLTSSANSFSWQDKCLRLSDAMAVAYCLRDEARALDIRDSVLTHILSESRKRVIEEGRGWFYLAAAELAFDIGEVATSESLLRKAIVGFVAAHEIMGEIRSRRYIGYLLSTRGESLSALYELDLAVARAQINIHGLDQNSYYLLLVDRAQKRVEVGLQLEENLVDLQPFAEKKKTSQDLHLRYNAVLGATARALMRYEEAAAVFEAQIQVAKEYNSLDYMRSAQYNLYEIQSSLLKQGRLSLPKSELINRMAGFYRSSKEDIVPRLKMRFLRKLADLHSDKQMTEEYLDECLKIGAKASHQDLLAACLIEKALIIATEQPILAQDMRAQAISILINNDSVWAQGRVVHKRIALAWALDPIERAMDESWAALAVGLRFREGQGRGGSRARFFADWVNGHRLASGYALRAALSRNDDSVLYRELIDHALQTQQLMRSRSLLDEVVRKKTAFELLDYQKIKLHAEKLEELASLYDSSLGNDIEIQKILLELHKLAAAFNPVRRQPPLTIAERGAAELSTTSLDVLEAGLAHDEVLVIYQVAPLTSTNGKFAGGSWVIVVAKDQLHVLPIDVPDRLYETVNGLQGLLTWSDGREYKALEALSRRLWLPLVDYIPNTVNRVIIVPDASLNRLPFSLLPVEEYGAPLGMKYEVDIAPSTTLWFHWRQQAAMLSADQVLTLADPKLSPRVQQLTHDSSNRLAGSRQESAMIERVFPGRVKILMDEMASERFFREHSLDEFRLIHFATHALIDGVNPSQSAVLLAGDGEDYDGLLTADEISKLDMSGKTIVLAACEGAGGEMIEGEGVLSLARAFLGAGAKTVVANLWPVDDQYASVLFGRFYHHMASGHTVSSAMKKARSDLVAAKYPAFAWAGYMVIGDSSEEKMVAPKNDRLDAPMFLWLLGAALIFLTFIRMRSYYAG